MFLELCVWRFHIHFLKHIHLRKGSQFQGSTTSDHFCSLMHTLFHTFRRFLNIFNCFCYKPLLNESSNKTSSAWKIAHLYPQIVAIVLKLPCSIHQCLKVPHISYGHWLSSRRKPKQITLLRLKTLINSFPKDH